MNTHGLAAARRELAALLDVHPPGDWSVGALRAVTAVIRVFVPPEQPQQQPGLRLIRSVSSLLCKSFPLMLSFGVFYR